jgi:hypothetical protein
MLYILRMGNHPDVSYRGGQQAIVHLQADFYRVIEWANAHAVPWAFSTGNAGSYLTSFYNDPAQLTEIDWNAVAATDFRDAKIKEGKQAEFLLADAFPWALIDKIGIMNSSIMTQVTLVWRTLCTSLRSP